MLTRSQCRYENPDIFGEAIKGCSTARATSALCTAALILASFFVMTGPEACSQQQPSHNQAANAPQPQQENKNATPSENRATPDADQYKPNSGWPWLLRAFVHIFDRHDKFWVALGTIVIAAFTVIFRSFDRLPLVHNSTGG